VMSYLYMGMRDQICAAVRLGMVGPRQGQKVLRGLLEEIETQAERATGLDYHQSFRCAAVLEIVQAGHTTLYSRLFQS
jgi:urease accessory protein